ncbi:MAG: hypothetical protein H6971_01635 [Gammaproteobacteria bacterium]|nr:hypothetical protein [Gammaproteobacteria bacterium]
MKELDTNTAKDRGAGNSRKWTRQNKLDFSISSEPHAKVAATFSPRFEPPDYLIELYKSLVEERAAGIER